jgi:hypothetical protein
VQEPLALQELPEQRVLQAVREPLAPLALQAQTRFQEQYLQADKAAAQVEVQARVVAMALVMVTAMVMA